MRNIFILFFVLFSANSFCQSTAKKMIASCCEKTEGRCTGSAYCSACTNCSRCAHCSNGGSCGVCAPSTTYTPTSKKTKYSEKKSNIPVSSAKYYKGQILKVKKQKINLRKGPGMSYDIIETLKYGTSVVFKEKKDDWGLVTVESTETTGYVFLDNLN